MILSSLLLIFVLFLHKLVFCLNTFTSPCKYHDSGYWSIAMVQIRGNKAGPLSLADALYTPHDVIELKHAKSMTFVNLGVGTQAYINSKAITCFEASARATSGKQFSSVSMVADPFLFIPPKQARSIGSFGYSKAGILDLLDGASSDTLFAFFEILNSYRGVGEIGGSVSVDGGATWHNLGTILSSFEHLSYPFVVFDDTAGDGAEDGEIVMFPQSNPLITSWKAYLGTQRVYATKPSLFPFGWKHVSTPLSGGKFADASPVFYKGRWYVWITEIEHKYKTTQYTLMLYIVRGTPLSKGIWEPHPANPISRDMRYARMGGRPVVADKQLLRPAQDCSRGYGMGVTWMHVTKLTETAYEERPLQRVVPQSVPISGDTGATGGISNGSSPTARQLRHRASAGLERGFKMRALQPMTGNNNNNNNSSTNSSSSSSSSSSIDGQGLLQRLGEQTKTLQAIAAPHSRLHHIDAQELAPGHWVVLVDGEGWHGAPTPGSPPPVDLIFDSAGSGFYLEQIVVALVFLGFLWYFRSFLFRPVLLYLQYVRGGFGSLAEASNSYFELLSDDSRVTSVILHVIACLQVFAVLGVSFVVTYSLCSGPLKRFAIDNVMGGYYYIGRSKFDYEHVRETTSYHPTDSPYPVSRIHLLTAVSSLYYARTLNLIGSLQHFEPTAVLTVYDIGLSTRQRQELVCLRNVKLVDFIFSKYPPHVKSLSNFAWKVLVINDYIDSHTTVGDAALFLDSGLQLVAPLLDKMNLRLKEYGHVSATQSVIIPRFNPSKFADSVKRVIGNITLPYRTRYCAGGFQGFVKGSVAHRKVLMKAKECALLSDCLPKIPVEDQGLFTALIRSNGFVCERKDEYLQNIMARLLVDELLPHPRFRMLARRFRLPLAFKKHVHWNDSCNIVATDALPVEVSSRPLLRDASRMNRPVTYRIAEWKTAVDEMRYNVLLAVCMSIGFIVMYVIVSCLMLAAVAFDLIRYSLLYFVSFIPFCAACFTKYKQTRSAVHASNTYSKKITAYRKRIAIIFFIVYLMAMLCLYLQSHFGIFV